MRRSQPVDIQRADWAGGRASQARLQTDRSLSAAHWAHLLAFAMALPVDLHGALGRADERTVFILILAYGEGLRRAELAAARTGDIRRSSADEAGEGLSLMVAGNGNRMREVALPSRVLERLSRYLVSRGLPASPLECPPDTPLIGKFSFHRDHTEGHLTGDHVAHLLKAFFRRAAETVPDVLAYVSALYAAFLEAACGVSGGNRNVSTRVLLAAGSGVGFVQERQLGWITGMAVFPLTSTVPVSPLRVHQRILFDPGSAPTDADLTRREFPIPFAWYLAR